MKEEQPTHRPAQNKTAHSLLLDDLYDIVQELLIRNALPDEGDRSFWLVCLSEHQQLLLVERLNSRNLEDVYANEVFQIALHKRAVSVLLCQVNSTPDLEFSSEEYQIVRQLLRIGHLIKLPILDFLVVNSKGYNSLRQAGELDGFAVEKQPPLTIEQAETITREVVEEAQKALESSYYNEREEIALNLYDEGIGLGHIMHVTGLSEVSLMTLIEERQ
jgi:hypothetical protein